MANILITQIIKASVIVIVALIICLTLVTSLGMLSNHNTKSALCVYPRLPLGAVMMNKECGESTMNLITRSLYTTNKTVYGNMSKALKSSTIIIDGSLSKNITSSYIHGIWSLTGYSTDNPVFSEVTFRTNGSYELTGMILHDGHKASFHNSGIYKFINESSMLLFVTREGEQIIYTLENIKQSSFSASNPNSIEYYNFIKLA